mmetsp:Transcript_47222/g.137375  ORF Transcript_47222/g.137375 Transcript_47222/m.137375 type:complete len:225 (-) Transcript_47222:87-761(-)
MAAGRKSDIMLAEASTLSPRSDAPGGGKGTPPAKKVIPPECALKFKKTMLCRFFPKCAKGGECSYAHSMDELRPRPNFTKTRLCTGFFRGRCPLAADDCLFAHGRSDLRSSWPNEDTSNVGALPRLARKAAPPAKPSKRGGAEPPMSAPSSPPQLVEVNRAAADEDAPRGAFVDLWLPPGLPASVVDLDPIVLGCLQNFEKLGTFGSKRVGVDEELRVFGRWQL